MRKKIVFEELEIDKLRDREIAAQHAGIYDETFNELKTASDAKKEAETEEDSSVGASVEPGASDEASGGSTDEQPADELTEAVESIRNYTISTEDIKDRLTQVGSLLWSGLKYMGELGVTYGPDVARNVYKGVIYTAGQIARLTIAGIDILETYIKRRINSYDNLQKQIGSLKKSLTVIKDYDKQTELTDAAFSSETVVNTLKIGESVDVTANIKVMEKFVSDIVANVATRIKNDVQATKHLIAHVGDIQGANISSLMAVPGLTDGMTERVVPGYAPRSENVTSYVYGKAIPGDVVFIATLPNADLEGYSTITEAYNNSSMVLGIDTASFKAVEKIDFMNIDSLTAFVGEMDKLCSLCISHQALYEQTLKAKQDMRIGLKRYIQSIVSSKTKIPHEASLVDYVHLKTAFIDKVYLVAAMDLHDYVAKVLSAGITYANSNIKALAQS